MSKKLRLLVFEDCNRKCEGCCNKDWDLTSIPVESDFSKYSAVFLTGGEPLLKPELLKQTIKQIKKVNDCRILMYTAMMHKVERFKEILNLIDGYTLTIHEPEDVKDFEVLCQNLTPQDVEGKSLRLNIFAGIEVNNIPSYWSVKKDMEWIVNCPLPQDEVFMRL